MESRPLPVQTGVAARPRVVALDLLRGAAILLVLLRHTPVEPEHAGALRSLAEVLYRFGWTGVDLFFVLSGYLIGGLLFGEIARHGTLDVRRFYARREAKILPSYFFYLISFRAALGLTRGPARPSLAWPNWVLLQNYTGTILTHTWSLAVEEHFYLALPLVLLAILTWQGRTGRGSSIPAMGPMTLAVAVVCTGLRLATGPGGAYEFWEQSAPTHLRIDGLFCGVYLAYLARYRPAPLDWMARHRGVTALASAALLAPITALDIETCRFVRTLGFACLYLGYGGLLIAAVHRPSDAPAVATRRPGVAARVLAFVGAYSYTIYLWHPHAALKPVRDHLVPALAAMGLPAAPSWVVAHAVYLGLATLVGWVASIVVERPFLRWRDRVMPPRSAATTPGDAVVVGLTTVRAARG